MKLFDCNDVVMGVTTEILVMRGAETMSDQEYVSAFLAGEFDLALAVEVTLG